MEAEAGENATAVAVAVAANPVTPKPTILLQVTISQSLWGQVALEAQTPLRPPAMVETPQLLTMTGRLCTWRMVERAQTIIRVTTEAPKAPEAPEAPEAPAQTVEMVATQPEIKVVNPVTSDLTVSAVTEALAKTVRPRLSPEQSSTTAAEAAEASRHLTTPLS